MDQRDDSIFPDAGQTNGTSEGGTTGSVGVSKADAPAATHAAEGVATGLRPGFLAELAVAMRATAEKERERIAGKVADDATAHVEKVRARAAIETDELKRLAEEDVHHIEEWSAAEVERIRSEADKKIVDRRSSLEEYLKQHDTIIDTEIEGVNAAVQEYNTTLDRYFEELASSDDPASIVARAEALPAPPDLDEVRAQARARAVSQLAERDEQPAPEAAPVAEAPVAEAPVAEAAVAEPSIEASTTGEALMAETSMAEIGAVAEEPAPVAETSAEAEPVAEAAGPVMAEAAEASTERDAPAVIGLIGDTPSVEEPAATAETTSPESEPVPVMDPAATANTSWPAPAQEPEQEPVAATVDHTSAAVRLLRSVAPWTAPTHAGSNDRSDND
jgi:hypothetical protein